MRIRMNYFKITIMFSILLLWISLLNGVYALTSVAVNNYFETGIVDIRITEHQIEGNIETEWKNNPTVLPGDIISKIPRIHNDGVDCYVRANITISEKDGTNLVEKEEMEQIEIHEISDEWVLADDGYFYYTKILETNQSVDLFQSVYILDSLEEQMMGKTIQLDINVDAIQSQNFVPQFDKVQPWGNVEILECEKEGSYDINSFKQSESKSFQIVYQGESKNLISNCDDFFSNFSYFMPGDHYDETVELVNNSDETIKLYFRSEVKEHAELLEKIKLKITTEINNESKVVYEGSLNAEPLATNIVLGSIHKNGNGKFKFEINVPEGLNNKYSILNGYVKWIFSTEPIIDSTLEPGDASQTGDDMTLKLKVSILGVVISVFLMILAMKKRKEEEGR